jgi:hypothetical protein
LALPYGALYANSHPTTQNGSPPIELDSSGFSSAGLPGEASEPWPLHSAINVPLEESLYWEPGEDAESFELFFWKSADPEPEEPTWEGAALSYAPPAAFEPGTLYSWRIVSVNTEGKTPSAVWTFTSANSALTSRESIGWNFDHGGANYTDTLAATDFAGAPGFVQSNWNNHGPASGQGPGAVPRSLVNQLGTATTAKVTGWTNSSDSFGYTYSGTDPNGKLMSTFAGQTPVITFADIPSDYLKAGYSVVVYYGHQNNANRTITLTGSVDDTRTRAVNLGGAVGVAAWDVTGYVEGTSTNTTSRTNYTVFTGLDDPGFSITITGRGISALQIVKEIGPPAQAAGPLPADSATDVAPSGNFAWRPANRATSYNLYLWKDGETTPTTPTATGLESPIYDPSSDLDSETIYHWRVDTVNSTATTEGLVWSFTTGLNLPPELVSGPTPAHAATGISLTSTFDWNSSARAATYELFLWKSSEAVPVTPTATSITPSYTETLVLEPSTQYFWRVDAVNGAGRATGEQWSFTTGYPPASPSSPSPAHEEDTAPRLAQLTWNDSPGATSYRVYFWPASETAPSTPTATVSTASYTAPALLPPDTSYSWRVDAVNAFGTTTGSTWTFTTSTLVSSQQSIGWNYDNGYAQSTRDRLNDDAVAGVSPFAQAHWNNHTGVGQDVAAPESLPFALLDNQGKNSGAFVSEWTVSAGNGWFHSYTGTNPNAILTEAYIGHQSSLTFGGIPAAYLADGYKVIVYYNSTAAGTKTITLTGSVDDSIVRSVSVGVSTASFFGNVGFIEGHAGNTTVPSNYTVFENLNDPSFSVKYGQNGGGINAIQIVKNPGSAEGNPFEAWALTSGLTGDDAGFDADSDYDGLPNGLEFLLGGQANPTLPGANSRALLPTLEASGDYLIFTFTRVHAASFIEAIVEFNSSLDGEWTEATEQNATIETDPGENSDTVTVRIPKSTHPQLFIRLRAVDPSAP